MKFSFDEKANEVYNEAGIVGFWKGVIPALIMVGRTISLVHIFSSVLPIVCTSRKISISSISATLFWYSATIASFSQSFVLNSISRNKSNLFKFHHTITTIDNTDSINIGMQSIYPVYDL